MANFKNALRSVVVGLTPPAIMQPVLRLWRLSNGLGWDTFYGAWPRLADVPVTRLPEGQDPWSETLTVRWCENLKSAEISAPTVDATGSQILPLLVSSFPGSLTVLDFGGGPGAGLINIVRYARKESVHYVLVEVPALVRAVRDEIVARGGEVLANIPSSLPSPLIVHAGSSIQYVADYQGTLDTLAQLLPAYLIISQTPMTDCATYARQILTMPHLKAATWVFNRAEFIVDMRRRGYQMIYSIDHDLPLTHGNAPGPSVMASMVFVPVSS